VAYDVCFEGTPEHAVNSDATLPIKLYLCDATGADGSSQNILVTALNVVNRITGAVTPAVHPGNADPDDQFKYKSGVGSSGGYMFNLKTTGLATGSYDLTFQVASDPVPYSFAVEVR